MSFRYKDRGGKYGFEQERGAMENTYATYSEALVLSNKTHTSGPEDYALDSFRLKDVEVDDDVSDEETNDKAALAENAM